MSEPLVELVVTPAMLRDAINAKLRRGTRRQTISVLVSTYAQQEPPAGGVDGEVHRLPVELIPHGRRFAFLNALNGLTSYN